MLANNSNMKSILVLTGEGIKSLTDARQTWNEMRPTHIAEDSIDAVNKIILFHSK